MDSPTWVNPDTETTKPWADDPNSPPPLKASKGTKGKGRRPERWLHCPRVSTPIEADDGNFFLAFKTPLDDRFTVKEEFLWNPNSVLEANKEHECKLGLVIDLTKTKVGARYDPKAFTGCEYVKVECEGHDGAPNTDQANKFIETCRNFWQNNPKSMIGVHCTHGFNRTGFLIASYLVDVCDLSAEAAAWQFKKARPDGIYKREYVVELYSRYDEDVEDVPADITRPEWCDIEEEPDDDENENNGVELSAIEKQRKLEADESDTAIGNGTCPIKGIKPVKAPIQGQIRKKVRELVGARAGTGFPGAQPVSMGQNNYKNIIEGDWMVSWKADGTRYLMYIHRKDVFLIGRDNCVFHIPYMNMRSRQDPTRLLENTLIDGELVLNKWEDTEASNKAGRPVHFMQWDYLAYDAIHISRESLVDFDYSTRLKRLEEEVISPRMAYAHKKKERMMEIKPPTNLALKTNRPAFGVALKRFWHVIPPNLEGVSGFEDTKQKMKTLKHELDGYIFAAVNQAYERGTCPNILKWKPANQNSIDFLLHVDTWQEGDTPVAAAHLFVDDRGAMIEFTAFGTSTIKVKGKAHVDKLLSYNGKIAELRWTGKSWRIMRLRPDKNHPNAMSTALSIQQSMYNPVSEDQLKTIISNGYMSRLKKNRRHQQQNFEPPNAKRPRNF
eukprot:m.62931 g.62931  ORF g.62931 m.62931 type:complete len:669 (+) comp11545_c0_seq1:286-2292(+)